MTITLTPEQHAWIDARIARGDFTSVEDAARQLIDERIAERAAEEKVGDLAWAKPYLDRALSDVAAGRVLSLEEHEARMDAVLASMKA
jgi:antitoxin ParD1/3/4